MLIISIAEEFSIIAQRELVRLKLYYRTLKSIIGINVSYFCQMDFFFFFLFFLVVEETAEIRMQLVSTVMRIIPMKV